jgi:hypothetical protein
MTTGPGCSTAGWTLGTAEGIPVSSARESAASPPPHAPDLGIDPIDNYWANAATRTFGELLIDCEEDRTLRTVLVGMLRDPTHATRPVG